MAPTARVPRRRTRRISAATPQPDAWAPLQQPPDARALLLPRCGALQRSQYHWLALASSTIVTVHPPAIRWANNTSNSGTYPDLRGFVYILQGVYRKGRHGFARACAAQPYIACWRAT